MKVADAAVISHAMYFQFQLFLYHQLAMKLEAILEVCQAVLAVLKPDEVQEAPEVVDLMDQRELQDQRKCKLAEMDNLYYLLLRSQV